MNCLPQPLARRVGALARVLFRILLAICWLPVCCVAADNQQPLNSPPGIYEQQIKPLLQEKCFTCHGALKSEAGLRLDAIQLLRKGGDSGPLISPADPANSELYLRVSSQDADLRMPPHGEGTPLTAPQLRLLLQWLSADAPGPEHESFLTGPNDHWAFRPIVRPTLACNHEVASPIDGLLAETHQKFNVVAVALVDDATWLRRVTLDLIGIPPTAAELQALQLDPSLDRRGKVIDRLLAHPGYGQRWGRHWMDVWRYSDWDGYKQELRGSQRHIWHWRDWIVESLNENKPYHQMLVEMLAGDELAPTDPQVLRATGFLARNYHKSNRDIWLDATVEHTGKAFLGLTFNCAKCHDHKYDPISQRHFYQLRAFFEPHQIRTDQVPGNSDVSQAGIPRAYDAMPEAKTFVYQRGDEKLPLKDDLIAPAVVDWIPAEFQIDAIPLPLESYQPDLAPVAIENRQADKRRAIMEAKAQLEKLLQPAEPGLKLGDDASFSAHDKRLAELRLQSLTLQVAMADEISFAARCTADIAKGRAEGHERIAELARRAALAEHEYKLRTAEMVLLQQQLANLKAQASQEPDTDKRKKAIEAAQKELAEAQGKLAELPRELPADAEAYTPVGEVLPRKSTGRRLALAKWIVDSKNPLTARVAVNHIWMRHFGRPLSDDVFDFGMKTPPPKLVRLLDWLAAEFQQSNWDMKHLHRLILLSDAYARESSPQAPQAVASAANDPDNDLFWKGNVQRLDAEQIRDSMLAVAGQLDASFSGPDIDFESGETIPRRSLYFRHAYEKQMQMMVLFDAASPNECYRRRPSVIPQQALVMLNSSLARNLSRRLAAKLSDAAPLSASAAEFVRLLFLATLSREPTHEELSTCIQFLDEESELLADEGKLKPFVGGTSTEAAASPLPEMRARESLALVMLNHNDFLSIR